MPVTTAKIKSLLVVDPRSDDYLELAAGFAAADYQIHYASCGDEALRLPSVSPEGLWLVNFRLPDMTGLELLAQVRSRDPTTNCILISDVYSATDELSARQFGVTLYGCKPLPAAWLHAIPAFRHPVDRDHSAHGPPTTRAGPTVAAARCVAAAARRHPTES